MNQGETCVLLPMLGGANAKFPQIHTNLDTKKSSLPITYLVLRQIESLGTLKGHVLIYLLTLDIIGHFWSQKSVTRRDTRGVIPLLLCLHRPTA